MYIRAKCKYIYIRCGLRPFDRLITARSNHVVPNFAMERQFQVSRTNTEKEMASFHGETISRAVCLEDLPVEILLHLVQTLFSFEDKVRFMSVSHRFYNLFVKDVYKQAGKELDWHPLMDGVKKYRIRTLQRCLEAGSPLDLRYKTFDYHNREVALTPLEYAIMFSNLKAVNWLLAHGVSCKTPAPKHMVKFSTSLLEFAFLWQCWSPKSQWNLRRAICQFRIYRLLIKAGAPVEHRVIATLLSSRADTAHYVNNIIYLLLDHNPSHLKTFSFQGIPLSTTMFIVPSEICFGWPWENQLPTLDLMLEFCELEDSRRILRAVRDYARETRDLSRRPEYTSQWREWALAEDKARWEEAQKAKKASKKMQLDSTGQGQGNS